MTEDRSYYDHPNGDAREHYNVGAITFAKFHLFESNDCYGGTIYNPDGARHILPLDASAEEIGIAILDALSQSRFVPPWDPEFDEVFNKRINKEFFEAYDTELMRIAGVKSKRSLYKGSIGVSINLHSDHDEIKIHACSRRSGRTFYSMRSDATGDETVPADASAQEIGAAYLRALALGGSVST